MFIIAIALLFIFLWCFAMFFQHMKDLSDWNKRREEEKEKYPKPTWKDTFEAMGLGIAFIVVVLVGIIGWLFF